MSGRKIKAVIDTNVLVVANGAHSHASPQCQLACIQVLEEVRYHGLILIDDKGLILEEYARHCSHRGKPGIGDYFFKWLFDRQYDRSLCQQIPVTPHQHRGFQEFPADATLKNFDWDDRKFVAVALASKMDPSIYNAVDSDYAIYFPALKKNKIRVVFLCPDYVNPNRQENNLDKKKRKTSRRKQRRKP